MDRRVFVAGVGDPDHRGVRDAVVPYASVVGALAAERVWMDEVRGGDGAHSSAAGDELLTMR